MAVTVSRATHAMETSPARESERATPHGTRMASAKSSIVHAMSILGMSAFAMNAAFTMGAAFAMDSLSILRVQCCLARPVSIAHDPAKVQSVIVRNFAPALASLVHCYKVVEG